MNPFGGVDPATRDYILNTILSNFEEGASVVISKIGRASCRERV